MKSVLVAVVFFATMAFADGASVLPRFDGCGLLDADGHDVYTGTGHLMAGRFDDTTALPYPHSMYFIVCRAQLPPPGVTIYWTFDNTGICCGTSTAWDETITPDGRATLRCRIRATDPPIGCRAD